MATTRRTAPRRALLKGSISLQTPLGGVLSDSRIRLLEAIDQCGSLNRAAGQVPLSYKAAWDALDSMNQHSPEPLVVRSTGGAGGGGTRLTDYAHQLIALYRAMESSQQDVLNRLPTLPAEGDAPAMRTLIRRMTMRSSARNQFAAEVTSLNDRGGMVDVLLDLTDDQHVGDHLVASITPESVRAMELRFGSSLFALIKAPWVSVMPQAPRRAAGRNALQGQVTALRPGQAHTGVTLTLPSGRPLQAAVPAAMASGLSLNQTAWGVFPTDSVVLVTFA